MIDNINNYENYFLIFGFLTLFVVISLFLSYQIYKKINKHKIVKPFSFVNHIIIFIVSVVVAICSTFIYDYFNITSDDNDISEKITMISTNLKNTAAELSIIQQQLEARIELVKNLKEEAEIAENVISLSEKQVNAVQSKINQELNANSGKSTISSFLISALFFVLGLIVQPIINFFKQKKKKYDNQDTKNKQYNQEELLALLNEVKNALGSSDDKSSKN